MLVLMISYFWDPSCCSSLFSASGAVGTMLIVPGNVVEADKMLVDVGTGYYVEKDQKKTAEFLERKVGGRRLCKRVV